MATIPQTMPLHPITLRLVINNHQQARNAVRPLHLQWAVRINSHLSAVLQRPRKFISSPSRCFSDTSSCNEKWKLLISLIIILILILCRFR